VLLTTQYLDEADQLAERIAVIDHGRVIAEGTGAELKASVGSGSLHVRLHARRTVRPRRSSCSRALGAEVQLEADPAALTVRADDAAPAGARPDRPARAGIAVASAATGSRASTRSSSP
jgi:ABC-2 type transport system ATP-binding protein